MKREPSATDLDRLEAIQRANPPRWWAAAERKQRTAARGGRSGGEHSEQYPTSEVRDDTGTNG